MSSQTLNPQALDYRGAHSFPSWEGGMSEGGSVSECEREYVRVCESVRECERVCESECDPEPSHP